MDDRPEDAIQEKVRERRERISRLDAAVVDLSRRLVREEAKAFELFVDNFFFLKMSDPGFSRLPAREQKMRLAFWSCERRWSSPSNHFTVACRNLSQGPVSDFVVTLWTGESVCGAVVVCARPAHRRKFKDMAFPVLSFSPADMERRPLEVAEEVFTFLQRRADAEARKRDLSLPRLPLPLKDVL